MLHTRLATTIFLFSSIALSQSDSGVSGGIAPEDCWYTRGGNAAHSGQSLTAPMRGPVATRWTVEFDGEIEGEPLAWRELIFVAEKRGPALRYLHVLRRVDGKPRYKARRIKTGLPLAMSVWGEYLVYRRTVNSLEVLRLLPSGIRPMATSKRWKFNGPVSEPVMIDRSIFVCADGQLQCFTVGLGTVRWRQREQVIGDFALRDDKIYLPVAGARHIELVIRKRSTGALIRRISSDLPKDMYGTASVAAGSKSFVMRLFDVDPETASRFRGVLPNAVVFKRGMLSYSAQAVTTKTPFAWNDGEWFAQIRSEDGFTWARSADKGFRVIANRQIHADLMRLEYPVSLCRDVAYLGSMAFDTESLEILWTNNTGSVERAVPIRAGLLTLPSKGQLCYLSALGGETVTGPPWLSASLPQQKKVDDGIAIVRDGTLIEAQFVVDMAEKSIAWGKKGKEKIAFDQLAWLSGEPGVPVVLSAVPEPAIVLEELEGMHRRRHLADLLVAARLSKDIDLFAKIIDMAAACGTDEKVLGPFTAKLRKMKKLRHLNKPIAKKVVLIREQLNSLDETVQKDIWKIYQHLPEDVTFGWRYGLLREILTENPRHAQAIAAVRTLLPAALRETQLFDALDWLEFAKASREIDLEILEPGNRLEPEIAWERRELTRYRMEWAGKGRDDLIGITSKHLFVVSSAKSPGSLARCLSIGELVCSKLDEIFKTDKSLRGDARRLKVILFDSREEYLGMPDLGRLTREIQRRSGHLSWTAGHYSRHENGGDGVSRMFLPKDNAEFRKVIGVFAHELTHHWLDQACPRFSLAQRKRAHPMPMGYWIVEGFAQLIESAVFDTQARALSLKNPTNSDLATVADKARSQGVIWQALFRMDHMTQARLPTKSGSSGKVTMRYRLGAFIPASQMTFFYAQSAAACQFLYHAENGKYREKLLDYVVSYYTAKRGNLETLQVKTAFGISARDLGKAVTTYANGVVNDGKW